MIETIIYLERVSNNNNLVGVNVNSNPAENTDIENELLAYIYDTAEKARIEINAEHEEATIVRTVENGDTYLDENGLSVTGKQNLVFNVDTPDDVTIVYFKIIAENGDESPVYTLRIEKMSTDTTLKEIYVDGKLVLPNEEGKYVTSVLDTVTNPNVKAITNSDLAYVRIALGDEHLHMAEGAVTMSNQKQTIIPITVRSQSGITKVTYVYINKISTSVGLESVTVDDKEANSYNPQTHTYRFLIDTDKTDFELFVLAESDYTTLEYEETEYLASFKAILNVPAEVQGKAFNIALNEDRKSTRLNSSHE